MSQKNLRYGLIVAVLAVWGIIVLRIVDSFTGERVDNPPPASKKVARTKPETDSFTLLANYNDPFLPPEKELIAHNAEEDSGKIDKLAATLQFSSAPEVIDPSFIKYLGLISSPETKKKAAIVSIHNREVVVKQGEVKDDIMVISISSSAITVLHKKRKFTIGRE